MGKAVIIIAVAFLAIFLKMLSQFIKKISKNKSLKKEAKNIEAEGNQVYKSAVEIASNIKKNASIYDYSQLDFMQINSLLLMQLEIMDKMAAVGFNKADVDQLAQINKHLKEYCANHSSYRKKPDYTAQGPSNDQNYTQNNTKETSKSYETIDFFKGCNDIESLKKRYRNLCKVYHPDSGSGNEEVFNIIKSSYETLLQKYGET